ncbi:MAG: hypothetical protein IPK64_11760 [bacterium]|nr:hypothetical protein [bacterium]MBK8166610.1 hypothetical protein [bacterium]
MRIIRLIVVCWAATSVWAAIAAVVDVPYSGQLVDNGAPLAGWHQVVVSLWDAPAAGTLLFSQSESVLVEQGVFHLELHVDDAIFAAHDAPWVGVAVDGAAELEPRVHIGAVPYAVRALAAPSPLPGVAFATNFSMVTVPSTLTWVPVSTVTLVAPADGHVWLAASGWWQENDFTAPHAVAVEFSLGEGSPPPFNQDQIQTGIFEYRSWPYSHTTILPATAGLHTYTCWVYVNSPSVTLDPMPEIWPATMQAMWVPNDYGN